MLGRVLAILAVGGATLAATGSAAGVPRAYSVAGTEACLKRLPDAVVGLPPATPPVPRARFLYSFPSDRFPPRAVGQLGAWEGRNGEARYDGATLSFFKNARAARTSAESLLWLYGGKVMRNVVIAWGDRPAPRRDFRTSVLGCLRVGSAAHASPTPKRPTPEATLPTFAGYWGGHSRGLRVSSRGEAFESVSSGCCVRVYEMTFQVLSLSGTLTRATAAYRVTSFKRYEPLIARLRVGQRGKLLLRNGIVTNTLTDVFFCSSPAWAATAACGA